MRRPAIAVAVALAVAGCGSTPSPQASDSEPPDQLGHAVLLEAVVPRWGPGPDRELLDDWGENPQLLDKGRTAVVLSRPVAGPGGTWVRAWVAPDPSQFPGDYFAWLPLTQEGRQMLRLEPAPACPAVGTIEFVAVLLAPDRLRCFGGGELTVTAKSCLSDWPRYDTDPPWYGTSTGPARRWRSTARRQRPDRRRRRGSMLACRPAWRRHRRTSSCKSSASSGIRPQTAAIEL